MSLFGGYIPGKEFLLGFQILQQLNSTLNVNRLNTCTLQSFFFSITQQAPKMQTTSKPTDSEPAGSETLKPAPKSDPPTYNVFRSTVQRIHYFEQVFYIDIDPEQHLGRSFYIKLSNYGVMEFEKKPAVNPRYSARFISDQPVGRVRVSDVEAFSAVCESTVIPNELPGRSAVQTVWADNVERALVAQGLI